MILPLRFFAARAATAVRATSHRRALLPRPSRSYATDSKQPGITAQFYKTFTRPIAKVLLVAVFTYQVVYWAWVKLETDEAHAEKDVTIAGLEAKVEEYQKSKTTATKSGSGKAS